MTDLNSFSIQFPRETDVREKALLIGATILMVNFVAKEFFHSRFNKQWESTVKLGYNELGF